jgi:hypothetical protein
MATPPDFSTGQVLTAAMMDQIGLWKVSGGTFTAATTFDVTGFISDYHRYRVVISTRRVDVVGMGTFTATLHNGGTAIATGYYEGMGFASYLGTTGSQYTRNNGANWIWGNSDSAAAMSVWSYDLFALTGGGCTYTGDGFSVGEAKGVSGGGTNNTTSTYDRIRIAFDYGTHTGRWNLYGYNQL